MTWSSLLENVLAELLSSAIIVGCSVLIVLFMITRKRAQRLKVLQIAARSRSHELTILVSHLVVEKGGAQLTDGTPSLHFEGVAVPIREIEAAKRLEKALHAGWLDILPDSIRKVFERVSPGFIRLKITVDPAPRESNKFQHHRHAILIGGPEFNAASGHFLELAKIFQVADPMNCIHPKVNFHNRRGSLDEIVPDTKHEDQVNLAVVQRVTFPDGQMILVLCGTGSNGTLAAVDWFVSHWALLDQLVGEMDFGVCLQCPTRKVDPDGWRDYVLKRQHPEGFLSGHYRRGRRRPAADI